MFMSNSMDPDQAEQAFCKGLYLTYMKKELWLTYGRFCIFAIQFYMLNFSMTMKRIAQEGGGRHTAIKC